MEDKIRDLMSSRGYTEEEAAIAYHLMEAHDRFTKMTNNDVSGGTMPDFQAHLFMMVNVEPHFRALGDLLARRVLVRDYPDGWGSQRASEDEG